MSDPQGTEPPVPQHLDPRKPSNITESGELERPVSRRRIDCDGRPEIADRRSVARRGTDRRSQGADHHG